MVSQPGTIRLLLVTAFYLSLSLSFVFHFAVGCNYTNTSLFVSILEEVGNLVIYLIHGFRTVVILPPKLGSFAADVNCFPCDFIYVEEGLTYFSVTLHALLMKMLIVSSHHVTYILLINLSFKKRSLKKICTMPYCPLRSCSMNALPWGCAPSEQDVPIRALRESLESFLSRTSITRLTAPSGILL